MSFFLTEDQLAFQAAARDLAQSLIAPRAALIDQQAAVPQDIYDTLAANGYFGMMVPEEFGGAGMDVVSYTLAGEELAKASASVHVGLAVHNSLACGSVMHFGTPAQKQEWLGKLASGKCFGAYALTEPDAGSDAGSLSTHAVLDGNTFVLNGSKCFVTNGGLADVFVTFVSTNPAAKNKGVSCVLVPKDAPGLEISSKEHKMGIRGSDTRQLFFTDCRVPAENLLGEMNHGFRIALALLESGRIGIAAQSVGIARAALEVSVAYAKERRQFGQMLANFQAIQFKLATMATRIEAARLLTLQAASLKQQGKSAVRESSMAKLFASEMVNFVTYEAVQIHGGYGYLEEQAVNRFYRDARVTTIYEGTSEVQQMVIAKDLLK